MGSKSMGKFMSDNILGSTERAIAVPSKTVCKNIQGSVIEGIALVQPTCHIGIIHYRNGPLTIAVNTGISVMIPKII